MNPEVLKKAIDLAAKTNCLFIATADSAGLPHIAAAGKIHLTEENKIEVTQWFCPQTMANLQTNKHVSIVLWDNTKDTGFQVIGTSEKIQDTAILDGYAPAQESEPMPQVERQLLIKPGKIIDFTLTDHSDREI